MHDLLLHRVGIFIAIVAIVGSIATACGSDTETKEVTVGPELKDCVGVGPRKCMIVNGEFFYDSIDGFEFEPGYEYKLRIERYDAYPGRDEPPADASMYGYRLIETIEKTRVGP